MPKLSINLVVRNGEKYVPFLLASLRRQTFTDWELVVVDNASEDNTVGLIESEFNAPGLKYRVIKNAVNAGFSPGHNTAYKETTAEYVLLLNADMYLLPEALEKLVKFLDDHPDTAAVSPRLMRWDFEKTWGAKQNGSDIMESARAGFTSQIDTVGMKLFKNRRTVEWLTRQTWAKDSESEGVRNIFGKTVQEVFGVSGALPMYRKSLLDKVLLPGGNIFDPTYHSYKEDLDLAYRLRNVGFVSYVLLEAVAYHDRTGAGPKEMGDWAAIKNKTRQSYFVRFHSYKNHLRTLYKNEYWQNFLLDFPYIFWYELKKFSYLLVFDPGVIFKGWWDILKDLKYTFSARAAILKSRRMYWKGIRRWF